MIGLHPDCPPGAALLADHLDAALAIGEDLLACVLPARADLDEADAETAPEAQEAHLRRLMNLEASLLLRLLQARRLVGEIKRADSVLRAGAALFSAQTTVLQTLIAEADAGALARPGDSHAYLRSRGLIAPEAATPSPYESLMVSEAFCVGGVARLGDLLDTVAAFLDLIDARFGLYGPDVDEDVNADASADADAPHGGPAHSTELPPGVECEARPREGSARDRPVAEPEEEDGSPATPAELSAAPPGPIMADEATSDDVAAGDPPDLDERAPAAQDAVSGATAAETSQKKLHRTTAPPAHHRSLAARIAEIEPAAG